MGRSPSGQWLQIRGQILFEEQREQLRQEDVGEKVTDSNPGAGRIFPQEMSFKNLWVTM